MRGSVYYQSSQLVKQIFESGVKKEDKINSVHEHHQKVSKSFKTMETYRNIWNNFFNYLKEHWKIKILKKLNQNILLHTWIIKLNMTSVNSILKKISAALGKPGIPSKTFSKNVVNMKRIWFFN